MDTTHKLIFYFSEKLLYSLLITIPANIEAVWFLEFGPVDLRCRCGWWVGKLGDTNSIYSAELGTDLPLSRPWRSGINSCCFGRMSQACTLHVGFARAHSIRSWSLVAASSLNPATFSTGRQLSAHAERAADRCSCYGEQSEMPAQSWLQAWLPPTPASFTCPSSLCLAACFQD